MASIRFKTVDVDGAQIFYREAGPTGAPALLLLHGFPTSSHMFRDLIPLLAERFHIVAPDLPGFGRSDIPSGISFAKIADIIGRFTERVGLNRFAIYIFDYGAPTGLRLALKYPVRVECVYRGSVDDLHVRQCLDEFGKGGPPTCRRVLSRARAWGQEAIELLQMRNEIGAALGPAGLHE